MNYENIPSDTLLPLFHAEVSNRAANIFQNTGRALLIGISNSDVDETPFLATNEQTVTDRTGIGSQCHRMFLFFRKNNPSTELWLLPVKENSAGVAASGSLTLAGTATADGMLNLYINATRIQVPVAAGDTAATLASATADLVNANKRLPATATAENAELTLTANAKGAWGNGICIELNMNGVDAGEEMPAGIKVEFTNFANGAGDPDLTEKLAVLGDKEYDFIANPFCDTVNLNVFRDWMNDVTGRWSDGQQIYGHVFSMFAGMASAAQTFGNARNDQHMTIWGIQGPRQLTDEWLAAGVGNAALRLINDPARPMTFMTMNGIIAPRESDLWDKTTRNTLLKNGISTFVADNGVVKIERVVTTYQRNKSGEADVSYRGVNTPFTLQYIIRRLRSVITSKFPDYKLADDGYVGFDNAVVTPGIIKAAIVAEYHDMCVNAPVVVENETAFNDALVVERDKNDPDRVNTYIGPDLVNQFLVFAALVEFRLNY